MKYLFLIIILASAGKSCNEKKASVNQEEKQSEVKSMKEAPTQIHDIWALTEIKGKAIDMKKFNGGQPNIEIYLEEKRVSGFSGCNNYFAEIKNIDDNSLELGPIASTKKFCMDVDEKSFFTQMNLVNRYELDQLELMLFNNDSLLLTFKKVD